MYDEYESGDGGGSSVGRKIALAVGVVAIAAAGFFAFNAVRGGDDDGGSAVGGDGTAVTTVGSSGAPGTTAGEAVTGDTAAAGTTETTADATVAPRATSTTAAATTSTAAATTTAAPTTTVPPTTVPATYPVREDGTPQWVTAIYDVASITLKGVVPDEAAKERLEALAVANARSPEQAATVNNVVTINPAMPIEVGVRVVELTSTRFPPGSAEILPEHAAELNRVVNAMNLLPNTTALIIGHADQRGDEVVNYILSRDRANAVLFYMVTQGIDASRLSATAVGEEELLSLGDDEAALALNRRTEFVIFNLLVP